MSIQVLRTFFMWCTVIDFGLLVLSAVLILAAQDWIYHIHGKWFSMPRDTFNVVLYAFLGVFKLLFFVFNVVPYVALVIMGN